MDNGIFRQGDVYIRRINTTQNLNNKDALPRENRGVVLAHGEVTGHAHVLKDPSAGALFPLPESLKTELTGAANGRLLRIFRETSLVHEEHDPIALEPGDYYIGIQIEYDENEQWRRVAD